MFRSVFRSVQLLLDTFLLRSFCGSAQRVSHTVLLFRLFVTLVRKCQLRTFRRRSVKANTPLAIPRGVPNGCVMCTPFQFAFRGQSVVSPRSIRGVLLCITRIEGSDDWCDNWGLQTLQLLVRTCPQESHLHHCIPLDERTVYGLRSTVSAVRSQ